MNQNENKQGFSAGTFLTIVIFLSLIIGGYFMLKTDDFEKNPPIVSLKESIYWNTRLPIEVNIQDDTALKEIHAYLSNGSKEFEVAKVFLDEPTKNYNLKINLPKIGLETKNQLLKLTLKVRDKSKWNFFSGNETVKKSIIYIDNKKPNVFPLLSSYGISKGGSALAIFRAEDKNLKELYIETNFKKRFIPTPFYKNGYYAVLVAWPVKESRFSAKIIAIDKAGNKTRSRLSFFLKNKRYKISNLKPSKSFINGKICDLAEDRPEETQDLSPTEKLDFVNRIYREENDALIRKLTTKVDQNRLNNFHLEPFYPLKNGKVVGSFGDHRYYKSDGKTISEAYHLGIDLASTKMADILITNPGAVIFGEYNGIYGNSLIVYHGLGLYSLYGHCSGIYVTRGDIINARESAAKTGTTGLALGDHLHFSILVQGVFVRPAEWMDKKWMQTNVTDVMEDAIKMIDKR